MRKADETLRNKLLALIQAFPGIAPTNIPKSQLRFLRPLEQEGKIECLSQGDTYCWYIAGQAPSPIKETPTTMPTDRTIADQLEELLTQRFRDNWRHNVTITVRADALYWIVKLAEWGIDERRRHFKSDASTRPAEAAASIASWTLDLEALVKNIEAVLTPKGGKS
jgi:hypothetical protein